MGMVRSHTRGPMGAAFRARVAFRFRGILRAVLISPILVPGVVLGMAIFIFYV